MTWALFVDSSNSISFEPEWGMSQPDKKVQSQHRTRDGSLYTYNWGDYQQFKFNLNFVNSSDVAIVNSWWATDTELLFMDEDDATTVTSVQIMNATKPLTIRVKPYLEYTKGTINLSTY